jgi:hypothetical protein
METAMSIWRRVAASKAAPLDKLSKLEVAAPMLAEQFRFAPAGVSCVCFRTTDEPAFRNVEYTIRAALNQYGSGAMPPEVRDDTYGFSWLVLRHPSEQLRPLISDIKTATAKFVETGLDAQLLCSLTIFRDTYGSRIALVYLYKRGTFYPFAPLNGDTRDNRLEFQIKDALRETLPIEPDVKKWFPIWGVPELQES